MAPTPEQASLAADPSTDAHALADLAHAEPDLWPAIAAHPNAYPGLIEWMHEHGLPAESAAGVPHVDTREPVVSGPPVSHRPGPRGVTLALVAAAACVALGALALTGWSTYSTAAHRLGSPPAVAGTVGPSTSTDYRFGAVKTWETRVDVVAPGSEGFGGYYAKAQAYPGLWLVTWPGDASGSGRLSDETVLAMNPDSGNVKWSITPGPFDCASSLVGGALVCTDTVTAALVVLDPSTGKKIRSPLNGVRANSVDSFDGDIVLGIESADPNGVTDTVQRQRADGTVVWTKSASCDSELSDDGVQVVADGEVFADEVPGALHPGDTLIWTSCIEGIINLGTGAFNPNSGAGGDSCIGEGNPFTDIDSLFMYGYAVCSGTKYPMLITHGQSSVVGMTKDQFEASIGSNQPATTVWSATLPGANLGGEPNWTGTLAKGAAHLGAYALLASAGHLYGVDTEHGPRWEQSDAFSGNSHVVLLPIDWKKPNTPVLALETDSDTIVRLDPGAGGARVASEPATLPPCPKGQTPVSFSTWKTGKGATLVCQGFERTVTVILVVDGKTYTSSNGSVTPTGYRADFGDGVSVDIGLGGWATWVVDGQTTTLHTGSRGWQIGGAARTYPALSDEVQSCPSGTYPLSLSTWTGGWLLTCGTTAARVTKFIYVDGSTRGSGGAMTVQDGLSCGTGSSGLKVCMSASPAVVAFSPESGTTTQHSVDANYVAGGSFGGSGHGTGAYGLADPRADAASQVAYLNGILQQSQAARSSVRTVIQSIVRCTSTTSDVQNAQGVVAARTTELQALTSAPVDAIPGGAALVEQFQAVLRDSLAADMQYVTAANQVANGQCAAGKATYATQKDAITQITNEKTVLANLWNGQIAAQYGTPTYTQDDI